MTTPGSEETELRPSEWWAQLKAQQQPWSLPQLPPRRPRRNRRTLVIVAASIGAVVVGAGVVVAVTVPSGNSKGNAAVAGRPSVPTTAGIAHPTVAGWQVVTNAVANAAAGAGADGLVAVDVPAGWTVGPGAGDDGTTIVAANVDPGVCVGNPHSERAGVTLMSDANSDRAAAVNNIVAAYLRDTGYSNFHPQINLAKPQPTSDGTYQDYKATVTLVPPAPPPPGVPPPPRPPPPGVALPPPGCIPPSAIVHVVAEAHDGGTFAVVVSGDQQVAGAVASTDLDQIASTVRVGR